MVRTGSGEGKKYPSGKADAHGNERQGRLREGSTVHTQQPKPALTSQLGAESRTTAKEISITNPDSPLAAATIPQHLLCLLPPMALTLTTSLSPSQQLAGETARTKKHSPAPGSEGTHPKRSYFQVTPHPEV